MCCSRIPAVEDVAVIGIPHEDYGQEVKAVVQLKTGYQPSDNLANELAGFCRSQLSRIKCPRTVDFSTRYRAAKTESCSNGSCVTAMPPNPSLPQLRSADGLSGLCRQHGFLRHERHNLFRRKTVPRKHLFSVLAQAWNPGLSVACVQPGWRARGRGGRPSTSTWLNIPACMTCGCTSRPS